MLTAAEMIDFSNKLEACNCATLDQFFFVNLGHDYWKASFYQELKTYLESNYTLVITDHKNGYKVYSWVDNDLV